MSMVSLATVVSFESVGAILVVALLVAPAATAYLFIQRLKPLLIASGCLGLAGAFGGYGLSRLLQTSISGSIATFLGVIFMIALIVHRLLQNKTTSNAVAPQRI